MMVSANAIHGVASKAINADWLVIHLTNITNEGECHIKHMYFNHEIKTHRCNDINAACMYIQPDKAIIKFTQLVPLAMAPLQAMVLPQHYNKIKHDLQI